MPVFPTVVHDLTRHRCEGCEFVCGSFRVLACQSAHQRTLSDGRKANEADTGDTRSGNIKTGTATTTTTGGGEQLALEFGELRFKLTQMVRGRLVLLSLGHLQFKAVWLVWSVSHAIRSIAVGSSLGLYTYFGLDLLNLN